MAKRLRKKHKRLKRKVLKDPELLRPLIVKSVARIKIVALTSDHCKGKGKYWERYGISSDGKDILQNVDALLDEIVRLQECVRDATDETIKANILLKTHGLLKEDKIEKLNIGKIIRRQHE